MKKMAKVGAGAVLAVALFLSSAWAQSLSAIPASINTPQAMAGWFEQEFRYQRVIPDYRQSAEELLKSKNGDCDDFAVLAQEILSGMGIKSQVLIIKFKGLGDAHAICVFKDGNSYNFISNQHLVRTQESSLLKLVDQQYPDWEGVVFSNSQREFLKVAMKDKSKNSSLDHELSIALQE